LVPASTPAPSAADAGPGEPFELADDQQLMGRIRRAGSTRNRVFCISLLITDSQEERYMAISTRQALFDHVHDEDSGDLFKRLDPDVLLRLTSP
jgi:hypothetical protein